ncbi:MAG TPA: helix-turn-helix domain-containing protein [Patescibacteria group bacterium]|nr:helix-turn-helix domain-containing protein [Patescibacteria group bacterium]
MSIFFCKKNLCPPRRVCFHLRALREKSGLSLEALAKKTKIPQEYLCALEACRFDKLPPGQVYQKNFLRRYAEALGANPDPLVRQYVWEETSKEKMGGEERKKESWWDGISGYLPSILRVVVVGLVVLSLIFYLGWQIKNIVTPPELFVYAPLEGFVTDNYVLAVRGQTGQEVEVSINGKQIRNNEQGQFEEVINLSPGLNTIVVEAKKKHGKVTSITRHVVLKTE